MNVYDQANVLAKGIRESEQYRTLKKNRDKIEADSRLKKMFTEYRMLQFEMQKTHLVGRKVPEEKAAALKKMHETIISNPVLKGFLEAEHRFATVMSDVHRILVEGLEIDNN